MAEDLKPLESDVPPQSAGDAPDPWIGRTLGNYVVEEKIGRGGMGVVYRARHTSIHRIAAIKVLSPQKAADPGYVSLFLREANAAAQLNHPNVVGVYDAGHADDTLYIVMEFVNGQDLGRVVPEGTTLDIPHAVQYIREAAAGLAHAHHKQLIHRDVKPENLILTDEGTIKVCDLGIAKFVAEEDSVFTQNGLVSGSSLYIAPEALRGEKPDQRSDIYSLGCTFFRFLTGRMPYEGSSMMVILAGHLRDPVPSPRDFNPAIDQTLAAIVQKMMAKQKEERYETMEEVDAAVSAYLQIHLSAQLPIPPIEEEARPADSQPALEAAAPKPSSLPKILGAIAALLVIGGAVFFVLQKKNSKGTIPPPTRSQSGPAATSTPTPAPTPAAAGPGVSEMLATFEAGTAYRVRSTRFGDWASMSPAPTASCASTVDPKGGVDESRCWAITFDLSKPGSFCGSVLTFDKRAVKKGDEVVFKVRSTAPGTTDLTVELRSGPDAMLVREPAEGVSDQWKTVRIAFDEDGDFAQFGLALEASRTSIRKGTILVDEIELIRHSK